MRHASESGGEEALWNRLRRVHPTGGIATAERGRQVLVYMASDDASFCTGSIMSNDGGLTAQ